MSCVSVQSDVELLYILVREKYAKKHKITPAEVRATFHKNHIL